MDYFDEILSLSKKLIPYESIYGHGGIRDDAVLGVSIKACQEEMLAYCRALGWVTYMDPEGMYSYAETSSGGPYIGILTHLDIVGAGDLSHWDHPPFDSKMIEDKLMARGVADDKVPAAIGVLSVKKIVDDLKDLKYPIRLIFGGDEETGFRGIKKYKDHHLPPKYTLVLDGTFPFSYSEKHLLNYELHINSDITIEGGEGYNSVMDHVRWLSGDQWIEVAGRSAHASRPEKGENALVKLAYMNHDSNLLFQIVNALVEPSGHHKLEFIDNPDYKKETSLCIGRVKNNILFVDLRVPPEMMIDDFMDQFESNMKRLGVKPVRTDLLEGVVTPVDSDFAKRVLKCYQEMTGDKDSQPFKTGSATYGRSFKKNCLSFGPRMGYHITNTHKPNEFIPFDLIENAFNVYVHTLKMIEEEL